MDKIKNNQSGFGAIETLLVIVLIAIIGFVGYTIFKNQDKKTNTPATNATTIEKEEKLEKIADPGYTGETTTYTDSVDGYSFAYPKEWEKVVYDSDVSISVQLTSPDYKDNGLQVESKKILSGATIGIHAGNNEGNLLPEDVADICRNADECIEVAGQKAARYLSSNEGNNGFLEVAFVKGDRNYDFSYSYPQGSEAKYLAAFQNILYTFKFNK